MQGRFITVEGVEGVGKSTQLETLKAVLDSNSIPYVQTREPGGTLYSEKIRKLLLQPAEEDLDPIAELLLIFAARAQHLAQLIKPSLNQGKWVLCDRFTDATFAYQGGGRDLGMAPVATLENLVQGELRPDLTVLFDLDPEIGLQRATERGNLDRFETEALEFFTRVREAYLQRAKADPDRFMIIDAAQSVAQVSDELQSRLQRWLQGIA